MVILDAELAARTPTQWYEESVRIPKISELEARKRVEAGGVDFLCEFIAENDKEDRAAIITRKWKYKTRERKKVEAMRLGKYGSWNGRTKFRGKLHCFQTFVLATTFKGGKDKKAYQHCEVEKVKPKRYCCRHGKVSLT